MVDALGPYIYHHLSGVGIDVPFWGVVSHHLQICVGDDISNSWVMYKWDIYQPLFIYMW